MRDIKKNDLYIYWRQCTKNDRKYPFDSSQEKMTWFDLSE